MKETIIERLDIAIRNMNNKNFEELFPIILDDLKYILVDFKNDMDKLSEEELFECGTVFNNKIYSYIAKLAKIYFKVIYGFDINIINSKDYQLAIIAGGFNRNDGNIYYSDFGITLSLKSNLTFLHTCLHEGRHKMQHDFYKSNELLLFPPYMLRLLKENLLETELKENNREFYRTNYNILFTENDAEIFAKREIHNFIKNMTQMYMKLYNKSPKEMKDLLIKISVIDNLFTNILTTESFEINSEISSQIYDHNSINCHYVILGKQEDRLIIIDKYIKEHPELQNQYPILKLLFNGNNSKSYGEIINDKANIKANRSLEEQRQIDELYKEIILSDPILALTEKLEKGDIKEVQEYLDLHPTITSEYPEEINALNKKYDYFSTVVSNQHAKKQ